MKTFRCFISEAVTDPIRSGLSPAIFARPDNPAEATHPKLLPSVKSQITRGLKRFRKIARITDVQIIGSILTRQYRNNADIDVNVVFDVVEDQREVVKMKLIEVMKEINGQCVRGTEHPINYYIVVDPDFQRIAVDRADNVYDVTTDVWLKKQDDTKHKPINVAEYMQTFQGKIHSLDLLKNRFKRNLIDYKEFKEITKDDAADLCALCDAKLKDLEADINKMIDIEEDVVTRRRAAFARDLTSAELEKYGTHNRLPDNILYKLLERYHYIDFVNHLKNVIGDDRILTHKEADQL